MSWFNDIAGKAENLLNKVDKSAATALQNKTKFGSAADIRVKTDQKSFQPFASPLTSAASQTLHFTSNISSDNVKNYSSPNYSSLYSSPKRKSESDDEKLLLFLNSPEKISNSKVKAMTEEKMKEPLMSKSAVSSSKEETTDKASEGKLLTFSEKNLAIPQSTADEEPSPKEVDVITVNDISAFNPVDTDSDIHKQLARFKQRAEHAEGEMKRMQRKLEHYNSEISGINRELKGRDSDLMAALDAKDSQLAVLKIRLEEADSEIHTKKTVIEQLKHENERYTKQQAESESMYGQTVESLRATLAETEMEMNKCKETFRAAQSENLFRVSKMDEEQRHMAENVTNLQRKWSEQNERNKDLNSQLVASNRNFDSLQQEYNDYKQKAQRILQSKEKLIVSLKEGSWDGEKSFENDNSFAMLSAEAEGIKQERDMLREELRKATEQVETCRDEIQNLEKMSQFDSNAARDHFRNLEEQLHQERLVNDQLLLHNTQLKEEIEFMKDNLTRTQSNLQSRIHDREVEIDKLRKQLTAKSLSTVSQDELESRLHALTENLIHKQTIVEALSTEKNSLVLQLERMEQQFKEAQMYGSQNHTVVGVTHAESERKQKPHLFLENPFDSHLTKRVKRAYGSIDALSIRMGVFFRRYPIARMFIIVYMLLLHFWVMIVLLTYEPEVHTSAYQMAVNTDKQ